MHTEHTPSDASSASASSTDQSACTTTPSAKACDFVQTPRIDLVRLRRMFELPATVGDPPKLAPRRGSRNLDDNFASRTILPTMGNGVGSTGLVGKVSKTQWICPLTADEWVDYPAKLALRGGSRKFDDNSTSRKILPTMGNGVGSTGLAGKVSKIQWICPLTADEWVDSGDVIE